MPSSFPVNGLKRGGQISQLDKTIVFARIEGGYRIFHHSGRQGVKPCTLPKGRSCIGDSNLLTEQEVARSWRGLFSNREVTSESMDRGEALLNELRAESPLRHRLDAELDELRKIHAAKS